jgi:hypothetical protein
LPERELSTQNQGRNTWSVGETRALLTAIEARYDDMHHVNKRKHFWAIISEELGSLNINV